jgi:hypothetical protein
MDWKREDLMRVELRRSDRKRGEKRRADHVGVLKFLRGMEVNGVDVN